MLSMISSKTVHCNANIQLSSTTVKPDVYVTMINVNIWKRIIILLNKNYLIKVFRFSETVYCFTAKFGSVPNMNSRYRRYGSRYQIKCFEGSGKLHGKPKNGDRCVCIIIDIQIVHLQSKRGV